jgi:hypothetical protein
VITPVISTDGRSFFEVISTSFRSELLKGQVASWAGRGACSRHVAGLAAAVALGGPVLARVICGGVRDEGW